MCIGGGLLLVGIIAAAFFTGRGLARKELTKEIEKLRLTSNDNSPGNSNEPITADKQGQGSVALELEQSENRY